MTKKEGGSLQPGDIIYRVALNLDCCGGIIKGSFGTLATVFQRGRERTFVVLQSDEFRGEMYPLEDLFLTDAEARREFIRRGEEQIVLYQRRINAFRRA